MPSLITSLIAFLLLPPPPSPFVTNITVESTLFNYLSIPLHVSRWPLLSNKILQTSPYVPELAFSPAALFPNGRWFCCLTEFRAGEPGMPSDCRSLRSLTTGLCKSQRPGHPQPEVLIGCHHTPHLWAPSIPVWAEAGSCHLGAQHSTGMSQQRG